MKNNKKGFTLVELLAVIVILAVVILIAVTAVLPQMEKAKKKNFINEANIYLTKAEEAVAAEELDGGTAPTCFTIKKPSSGSATNYLNGQYVKKADTNYDGVVEFVDGVATIYLTNGTYYVTGATAANMPAASSLEKLSSAPTGFKTTCS